MPVSKADRRPNVLGLQLDELTKLVEPVVGEQRYRARQIFGWVYAKGAFEFDSMHNLSRDLRKALAAEFVIEMPRLVKCISSEKAKVFKYLLSLADRMKIECVLIGMRNKDTFCISSQVGCRFHCAFCVTGRMGLKRDLSASEILGQILFLRSVAESAPHAFNVVFMGMGEPLDNYDGTVKAIRIMEHPDGLAVGGRRITVSTCGIPDRIRRLAKEELGVGLALSLNATTDELRAKLVPAATAYRMKDVLAAVEYFAQKSGRRVTLEYVLIGGVNDKPADAKRLAAIASSLPSKINLIEFNDSPGARFVKPSEEAVRNFMQILYPRAPAVTLRKSKGSDIMAACGQLGAQAGK
ncbi:MAG: 23S rRNA (adenine(2503)-C(2))-methyltransferase RlmN [Candidatus Eisenbacteria bacterium]|nr:23S rRNA (adenine(2503)-C(2))-methyltransferase RlmN [Candidatus Eisenbacteria bacterium]